MPIILGFLAGVGLPIQTSVNTRLRKKVGSPFNAALVSFLVGLLFLSALLLVTGHLRRGVSDGKHLAVSEIRRSADGRASGSRPNLNGIDH